MEGTTLVLSKHRRVGFESSFLLQITFCCFKAYCFENEIVNELSLFEEKLISFMLA